MKSLMDFCKKLRIDHDIERADWAVDQEGRKNRLDEGLPIKKKLVSATALL